MQQPTERLGRVEQVTSTSIAAALGLAAALRRGKAVHPKGVVYSACVVVDGVNEDGESKNVPAARLFAEPAEHRAIVRFSRSIGLPEPLPDLLGMSIRVLNVYGRNRHQDLMLISSIDRQILHHVFVPVTDVWQAPYSSALPYRVGAERLLIGALPRLIPPQPQGDRAFGRLQSAVNSGQLSFELAVAALGGRFRPVAELWLEDRLSDDLDALCFNPWNTGADLQPAGWLNAARFRSYQSSQSAWRRTMRHGAQRQDDAEMELVRQQVKNNGAQAHPQTGLKRTDPGLPV